MAISVDSFKLHAGIQNDPANAGAVQAAIDANIQRALDAAIDVAELKANLVLVTAAKSQAFSGFAAGLSLVAWPVRSIVSVQYWPADGGAEEFVDSSAYFLEGNVVRFRSSFAPPLVDPDREFPVTVNAMFGFENDELPASLEAWVILYAQSVYDAAGTDSTQVMSHARFIDGLWQRHRRMSL